MAIAIEIADRVTLVDNTELPIECAQAWQGTVERTVADCPNWVEAAIAAVEARRMSREIWQLWANTEERLMLAANAWSGSYQGEILRVDDLFLLQEVGETVVLHDRLLLKSDYAIGQVQSISYREGVG